MDKKARKELLEELNSSDSTVGLINMGLDKESIGEVLEQFNYKLLAYGEDGVYFTDGTNNYEVIETNDGKLDVIQMLLILEG